MTSIEMIKRFQNQINVFDEQLSINFSTTPIESLLENRATFIDGVVTELWNAAGCANQNLSLNAVGGYGRKTLHPHSDIDICVLYESSLSSKEEESLQVFMTQLWDLGLTVGQSVRSLSKNKQMCKNDISIATNLLEIRTITGTPQHARVVKEMLYSNKPWNGERFFTEKLLEQKERHLKLDNQAFKLEPNIKEGPGGLRDVQTVFWILQKEMGTSDFADIRRSKYFNTDEFNELIEAQNFIWRVRWALHKIAGRDENRLLLEYQADIASLLGFGDTGNLAIEKMMRQVFRATKRIKEINQMLMAFIQFDLYSTGLKKVEVVNQNFEIRDDLINVRAYDVFVHRKEILSMFRIVAQSGSKIRGITPQTIRLMRQARRRLLGDLQDFEECRTEFLSILAETNDISNSIKLMHHHGILAAYLTQWRNIVGQMQFDLFHAYTVDEHIFQTILNVVELTSKSKSVHFATYQPLFSKLIRQRPVLLLAALFHDIGKGRGGDHSELGAVDAKQFCQFHGLKRSDIELVTWLVENHLLMSITSQQQDISDPEVVKNFAKKIGTQSRLDALYCLTIADINATNPNLWTGWKASLLERLYIESKKALLQGLENVFTIREKIKERKKESLAELEKRFDLNHDLVIDLWRNLPLTFFSNTEIDEIVYFSQKALLSTDTLGFISISEAPVDGCSCIFAYLPDRESLFSDLFSALNQLKVDVKDAQLIRCKNDYILELIKVLDYNGNPIETISRKQDVEDKLQQQVLNRQKSVKLASPKYIKNFENKVQVEYLETTKTDRTLVSITALDNPNFMTIICQCFREMKIKIFSAKLTTVGEMVENVFMVSNSSNSRLNKRQQSKLSKLLVKLVTS
ncbi:[protein-PII] uridylyltransferase [Aliikangiella marina]|uniref:Bifunctional uridylyltransferase/uridylyl-removing enzyme n=1 Tax=Aliikangiella marina TaxID=1712262 RepID=A0A545TJJ2_9GAMM|nr:[protein-PII] uridylyltransferase [Aliikangiella marina]TQV77395.1 [protein-PII] uridylyltransferase [Aliikangiella marina]